MIPCAHKDFVANVSVGRITESAPEGVNVEDLDPHSFIAEIEVRCSECGEVFGFKGIDTGFDYDHPTQAMDGRKAVLPLRTPAEMAMAGALAALDVGARRAARGVRLDVKAIDEGPEPAIVDAVKQRTTGWLAAYREGLSQGLDDTEAQRQADTRMEEEFGG